MSTALTEPYEDPTPSDGTALTALLNIHKVTLEMQDERQQALNAAYAKIDEEYRAVLARCQAHYWEQLAVVYGDGFTPEDVAKVLKGSAVS